VVKVDGYNKKKYLYGSGVNWINPSPNIPAYDSALVYPGVVMFEGTNISLGRGTTRPFVYSGAPWMDSASVVAELRALNMRDVRFSEVVFRPNDSIYKGIVCKGVQITAIGRSFDTLRVGYEYMRIFRRLHPYFFRFKGRTGNYFTDRLWGSPDYREAIEADMNFKDFEALWKADEEEFRRRLEGIRLY
jgi:beta-N-acetylhexosaminidase